MTKVRKRHNAEFKSKVAFEAIKEQKADANNLLLTATVMNTLRLEDWLVSMSHMSEVIEPKPLRENVIERLKNALAYYQ